MIYLLTILIVSPSFWITSSVNINVLDMCPLFFIIYLLMIKKHKITFTKNEIYFLKMNFILSLTLLLSTFIAFIIFESNTINTFLQLYRRLNSFIIIPLFVFIYYSSKSFKIEEVFLKLSMVLVFVSIIGESVNFIPFIRDILHTKFVYIGQIVIPGFYRNAGFTGEASYFANLMFFGLIINLMFNIKYKNFFIIFFIISILSTFSKSVILSAIIVVILYMLMNKKLVLLIKFICIFLLFLTLFIWYFDISEQVHLYFTSRATSSFETRTNVLWIKVINFIYENDHALITGLGFKGLKYYVGIAGAHNQYLSIYGNFGLLSIFYFLILFIIYPIFTYKISKNMLFIYITIFMCIESFVHEPYTHAQVFAFYMFILSIVISYNKKFNYFRSLKNEKSVSS